MINVLSTSKNTLSGRYDDSSSVTVASTTRGAPSEVPGGSGVHGHAVRFDGIALVIFGAGLSATVPSAASTRRGNLHLDRCEAVRELLVRLLELLQFLAQRPHFRRLLRRLA